MNKKKGENEVNTIAGNFNLCRVVEVEGSAPVAGCFAGDFLPSDAPVAPLESVRTVDGVVLFANRVGQPARVGCRIWRTFQTCTRNTVKLSAYEENLFDSTSFIF